MVKSWMKWSKYTKEEVKLVEGDRNGELKLVSHSLYKTDLEVQCCPDFKVEVVE